MATAIHNLQLPKMQRCQGCHDWKWCDAEDVYTHGYICRDCLAECAKSEDTATRDLPIQYHAHRQQRMFIPQ